VELRLIGETDSGPLRKRDGFDKSRVETEFGCKVSIFLKALLLVFGAFFPGGMKVTGTWQ